MSAGPYSDDTVWVTDNQRMILHALDDVIVAFHKISGDTHILNFLSAAVIKTVAASGETFSSAAPKILAEIQMKAEDCPRQLIIDTFLQLDEVGLIAPKRDVA